MKNQQTSREYREAENYLLDIPKFTSKNQFEDTAAFYAFLGRPGERRKIIHVAGTNGKGSVCAYLEGILTAHGFSCGLFTSPHLVTMRERIVSDGCEIGEEDFVRVFRRVREAVTAFGEDRKKTGYHPTFFEYLFFMAMVWYEEKRPEYIILETGLGGRLDTTNVVDRKSICILTKIALDHTEYLGNTVAAIAGEKAGILRAGTPLVFLSCADEAEQVVRAKAAQLGAEILGVSDTVIKDVKSHEKFIDFSFTFQYYGNILVRVGSPAVYQSLNVSLSLAAAERLLGKGLDLGKTLEAVKAVSWPCRMEEMLPGVFVDGAHNPDGIQAFLESVSKMPGRKILLFSVVKDKNQEEMIRMIASSGLFEELVVTAAGGKRAGNAEDMAACFRKYLRSDAACHRAENPADAFAFSRRLQEGRTLFVCGSLYLAGEVKSSFKAADC